MEISANHSIVSNTTNRSVSSAAPIPLETIAVDPDNADMSEIMSRHLSDASGINLNTLQDVRSQPTIGDGQFSAAENMGELDLHTELYSAGSPMELVDRVTEQMEDLGRTALLTQTNQLPPVAMPLGE